MSNRHLKRLEQQNDLKGIATAFVEEELVNEDVLPVKPPKASIFQLLADASNDEDDDEVEDNSPISAETQSKNAGDMRDDAQSTNSNKKANKVESNTSVQCTTSTAGGKNKGRKKRKNKKSKGKDTAGKIDDEDELERELKYIEDQSQPVKSPATVRVDEALKSTLSFHAKFLNPERELRQKFGSAVVREERNQQQPLLPRGVGKRLAPGATRSLLIPDAALHFLVMQGRKIGGITMQPVPDRVGYFEYKYSPDYWRTQAEFMLLVNSFNQDEILGMLQRIGDHIDTLLQVATIYRTNEEKTRASEFIEQAIFVMERAFHSAFDLHSGNCRLDYRAKPNRPLFIALFQHAYYLSERGCPRTALEVCKVLLSLDPEFDPLAVLLVIDHYALRAQEDEWLVEFFNAFQKAGRNLDQLVNFAYSIALSHFRLKRYEEADQLLVKALTNFPNVLKAIADKNSIMMDKKTATVFDKHYPYHVTAHLYAERCAWMYREPEVMRWMERTTTKMIDSGIRPVTVEAPSTPPRNVLRHIIQSHVPGVTLIGQYLPEDRQAIYDFDPFPPKNAYGDLSPKLLAITPDDMLSESTLANFLNSLNPAWTGQDENADNNAANNVMEGVSNLVDAVLNLMSNITGNGTQQQNNNDPDAAVQGEQVDAAESTVAQQQNDEAGQAESAQDSPNIQPPQGDDTPQR